MHDSCQPRSDHTIKEGERPSLQLPWSSTFRDQDDFDYTIKLLQKSLGESVIKRRKPPHPVEVLSNAFPSHKENVLELVLQGCSGDIMQAIECILAAKSNSMEYPASPNQSLPNIPLGSSRAPGSSYPGIQSVGVKRTLHSTIPSSLFFNTPNGVIKTSTHPLNTTGVLSAQAHGGLRFPSHLKILPVQAHRGGNEYGELLTISSTHSPDESSFTESEVSACFRCGRKPRSGDRFCGKCGADLKC